MTKKESAEGLTLVKRLKPSMAEVKRCRALMQKESERGCILVGAALLDERLAALLRSLMVGTEKELDALIESEGKSPLGSFSARIKMVLALGILPRSEARDLDLIRKVRNRAAHFSIDVTFALPQVRDRCRALVLGRKITDPRERFTEAVARIAGGLGLWTGIVNHFVERGERKKVFDSLMRFSEYLDAKRGRNWDGEDTGGKD